MIDTVIKVFMIGQLKMVWQLQHGLQHGLTNITARHSRVGSHWTSVFSRKRCLNVTAVCFVAGVGKSCLLLQFTDKRFQPVHDLTIGQLPRYITCSFNTYNMNPQGAISKHGY